VTKKSNSSLRKPPRPPDDINRFMRDNVRDPDAAVASLAASPPGPVPERVQPEDLLADPARSLTRAFHQDPSGVTEVHGPLMSPQCVLRFPAAASGSPAPTVSSTPPSAYVHVGESVARLDDVR
jgi:hypothetical protein